MPEEKPLHILHLVHQYLPEQVGGTELYTHWLSHELRERGHQVSVFCRRDRAGAGLDCQTNQAGLRICGAWSGRVTPYRRFLATFRDPTLVEALERVLDETRPDLVHVQHLMGLPTVILDRIQERGLPYVVTLWDFWWACANAQLLTNYSQEVCGGPRMYLNCARCALARAGVPRLWPALPLLTAPLAWRNHRLRGVLRRAARLIAPTAFVQRWYTDHGAPTKQLVTVEPGLNHPAREPAEPQKPQRPLRFAYIGGLSSQKGVHVLVEAFRELQGNVELWIAGDETAYPEYVSRLRELALSQGEQGSTSTPEVRFLGKLSREQVWETLAQVDVVVVPSMWYETFSFIVSEAFAMGAPVIASRLGPLADRVRDGVDGLLVPPGNRGALQEALTKLLENPALLSQLRAGIRPVKTMRAHGQEMEAVYRAVLAENA